MFSFCSEQLSCAVLYSVVILCCYVGNPHSLYGGFGCHATAWFANFYHFGSFAAQSTLAAEYLHPHQTECIVDEMISILKKVINDIHQVIFKWGIKYINLSETFLATCDGLQA